MKVLHVQKVKGIAGSEKFFLEMLPLIRQQGIDISFCCIYPAADEARVEPFIRQLTAANIKVHALKITSDRQILKVLRFLGKLIAKEGFDIVHAHLIHADLWCSLCARLLFNRKWLLVSTKHGYDEVYMNAHGFDVFPASGGKYLKLAKFAEKKIDFSFALSKGLGEFYHRIGITAQPLSYIYHGYAIPAEIHTYPKQYDLVLPGRYTPLKNHALLLASLAEIEKSGRTAELVFSGHFSAEQQAQMEAEIVALGLRSRVQFIGHQPDILRVIAQARICIIPSKAEGFGLVVLDAFAAQTPVIVNDTPALNEIVAHGKTGRIFERNDAVSLARQITDLLDDPAEARLLAENAWFALRTDFSLSAALDRWMQMYAALPVRQAD